ncbi:hypothetical protein EMCRGX_G001983 [Ephydatia muelleri]
MQSIFKVKNLELTFAKVFAVAIETEEAVKVAKEMAYGSMGKQTEMVNNTKVSLQSEISGAARTEDIHFTVTKVPRLYLLGQDAMIHLGVNILGVTYIKGVNGNKPVSVFKDLGPDIALQRDFALKVNFKTDASSVFCKPRVVPIAIQDDLVQAYGAETAKSVWKSTQFNSYGTQSSQLGRNHQGKGPGLIHLWGDRLLSHSQPTVCAVPYATTGRFDAVVDMASHRLIQQMVQSEHVMFQGS